MENIESILANIRFRVLDEITDRLEKVMKSKGFIPSDTQLAEVGIIIAAEVKDGTLEQIESCLDTEIGLSVDFIWDTICDQMDIYAPVADEDVWADENEEEIIVLGNDHLESEENVEPASYKNGYHAQLPKSGKCPGCCDKVEEKINEKEGIQTHIADMEW